MSSLKTRRKEIENLFFNFFSILDPSGRNTKKYKELFSSMSDDEFDKYMKRMCTDNKMYPVLDIVTYEFDLAMENIKKAANFLNVPLFEYVMIPHISDDPNNPIATKYKVPVGYIHEKRVQQMVRKKTGLSTEITKRDARTGQVVDEDKNARITIDESFCLLTFGGDKAAKEFLSARSDDLVMKEEMYTKIRNDGFVTLDSLNDKLENKTALNTLDVYLTCMGLRSDLIADGEMLPYTIDEEI